MTGVKNDGIHGTPYIAAPWTGSVMGKKRQVENLENMWETSRNILGTVDGVKFPVH